MSLNGDLKIALGLMWDVHAILNKSATDPHIYSSEFNFQGKQCRLAFNSCFDGEQRYRLYLENVSGDRHEPFESTVEVEDVWRQKLPSLKSDKYVTQLPQRQLIWERNEADVVQANRDFYRYQHLLRYQVLLKASAALVKDSVATQTEHSHPVNELSCLENLSQDLAQLMTQDSDTDVEFKCADESTRAHKLIVCSRSPVLASMLAADMVEKRTGVVTIPNMAPEVFGHLLKYIYTGTLDEVAFDVALSLYEAGDQYAVRGLAKRCSRFLLEQLTVDNACDVLVLADAHSDDVFKGAIVRFMVDNKVPQVHRCWPEFCSGHPELATVVLNRLCNAVTE